ncbi:MAG: FAD:protein FMN transferase [Verrucomicrobiota bacterium]
MTRPVHTFEHEAMKTTFTLRIENSDTQLNAQIVGAVFQLIDDIEQKLSRYIPGSDVWQINHMKSGESLYVSDYCYDCMRASLEAYQQTKGLFDITLGTIIEHKKNAIEGDVPEITGQIMVDPERPAIHCIEAGREIDLGGIGKGYTLDKIAGLLKSFGIQSALISAGASTQLAFGSKSWTINLGSDQAIQNIELKDRALSASGTLIQGSHIIFPALDTSNEAAYVSQNAWVVHKSGAMADAWSTAAMFIDASDFELFEELPPTIFIEHNGQISRFDNR